MILSQKQYLPFTQHCGYKYLFNLSPDSLLTLMGAMIPVFHIKLSHLLFTYRESVFHKMDFHSMLLIFLKYIVNEYFHILGIHTSRPQG